MPEVDIIHIPELLSRDGTIDKDSFIKNGYYEKSPIEEVTRKRPGYAKFAQVAANAIPYGITTFKDAAGDEKLLAVNGNSLLITAGALSTATSTSIGSFAAVDAPRAVFKGDQNEELIEFFVSTAISYGTYTSGARVPLRRVSTDGGTSWTTSACPQGTETGTTITNMWGYNNSGSYGNGSWTKHRSYFYHGGGFGNNGVWRSADKGATWEVVSTSPGFANQNHNGVLLSNGDTQLMHLRYVGSSTLYYPIVSNNDGTTWSTAGTVAFGYNSLTVNEWPTPVFYNNRYWVYCPSTNTDNIYRAFGSLDGTTWTNYGTAQLNTNTSQALNYARNIVVDGALYSFGGITSTAGNITNQPFCKVSYNGARFYSVSTNVGIAGAFLCPTSYSPSIAHRQGGSFYVGGYGTGSTGFGVLFGFSATRYNLLFAGQSVLSTDASNLEPGQYDFSQNYARTKVYMKNAYKLYEYDTTLGTNTQVTDADYPPITVRGMPTLDDYAFVMDPDGNIYNSAEGDFSSWAAADFIAAQFENDGGVALTKIGGNIVALGSYTTEQFFNAGNAVGSPLAPVQATPLAIGCAAADTMQSLEDTVYFVAQSRANQQSVLPQKFVARLVGNAYEKVSQSDHDRIIARSDPAQMSALISKQGGHSFYILRLLDQGISLVLDTEQGRWYVWTARDQDATATMSAVPYASGTATRTGAPTAILDGDYVTVSGFSGTDTMLNGSFDAIVPASGTLCWQYGTLNQVAGTSTTTGTATYYGERAYPFANAVGFRGTQVMQHIDDGYIHSVDEQSYLDDSALPIDFRIRTTRVHGGTSKNKFWAYLEVIGDQLPSGTGMLRYSDDDAQSWTPFQRKLLSLERQRFNRLGKGAHRTFEYRSNANALVRIRSMKAEAQGGSV